MAVGATSLGVSGKPFGAARVVKIDEGKDLEALDRAKYDGADHVFIASKGDIYVATAKSLDTKNAKTGEPIEFGGKVGKVLFPVNALNSRDELLYEELPRMAKSKNLGAGVQWAALFGGMGAMLGWMAGKGGPGTLKAMATGAVALPAVLVGIPMALLAYMGYQELKAKANPPVDALDRFGKVLD